MEMLGRMVQNMPARHQVLVVREIHRQLRQREQVGPSGRDPRPPREGWVVPSISEISSQSSDEEGRRGRVRDMQVPGTSGLFQQHRAAAAPPQQLDLPSESSGGETTTTESIVPDPEMLRNIALQRAERKPQIVPKIPSRLKKELVSGSEAC